MISQSTDDAVLLALILDGNRQAFNILYERYWDQAYSAAYKRLNDEDQSKDIVQEIFINIWLKRDVTIVNFRAYLNIAVRNRVFKLVEKQKHSAPFFDWIEKIPERHTQADSNLLYREFYNSYESLLDTLPPKRQMIFRLRYHEDLNTKLIAQKMGITMKTVQNQLGKAIEHLRILLPILLICMFFLWFDL